MADFRPAHIHLFKHGRIALLPGCQTGFLIQSAYDFRFGILRQRLKVQNFLLFFRQLFFRTGQFPGDFPDTAGQFLPLLFVLFFPAGSRRNFILYGADAALNMFLIHPLRVDLLAQDVNLPLQALLLRRMVNQLRPSPPGRLLKALNLSCFPGRQRFCLG